MKTHNIVIATGLILLLSSILTGCTLIEKSEPAAPDAVKAEEVASPEIMALIEKAKTVQKEASLMLDYKKEAEEITVNITIENPEKKPITSVQSWLSFDVNKLKGISLDTSESDFSLQAPYDNAFDNENGLFMLGRSHSEPIISESIHVATITFEVLEEGGALLEAYDYREDLAGHTSANIVVENEPFNVLLKPESPLLIIQ